MMGNMQKYDMKSMQTHARIHQDLLFPTILEASCSCKQVLASQKHAKRHKQAIHVRDIHSKVHSRTDSFSMQRCLRLPMLPQHQGSNTLQITVTTHLPKHSRTQHTEGRQTRHSGSSALPMCPAAMMRPSATQALKITKHPSYSH